MSLQLPINFQSPSNPDHKIQYVHLNVNGQNTLIYCYGAGGSALNINLYQSFLTEHPSMSILCIDRWCLGNNTARTGPSLLSELTSITLELLDSLEIENFSVAAHSAGAYQLLDLVNRSPVGRVKHVFNICTHIPAPFTASKIMSQMCTMPNFLFDIVTNLDSSLANTWAEKMFLKAVGSKKADRDELGKFVNSKQLRKLLGSYKPSESDIMMANERKNLDYRVGYTRIPGITMDLLTGLHVACSANITWFTCDADVFFGPASVERIGKEMKEAKIEVVVVDDASHADIFMRTQVWQSMYEHVTKSSSI